MYAMKNNMLSTDPWIMPCCCLTCCSPLSEVMNVCVFADPYKKSYLPRNFGNSVAIESRILPLSELGNADAMSIFRIPKSWSLFLIACIVLAFNTDNSFDIPFEDCTAKSIVCPASLTMFRL